MNTHAQVGQIACSPNFGEVHQIPTQRREEAFKPDITQEKGKYHKLFQQSARHVNLDFSDIVEPREPAWL